jgi:hypothetical protein
MSFPGMPGPMPGRPSVIGYSEAMSQYSVNRDGWEALRYALYDSNSYPTTGISSLSFFTQPVGQGTGWTGVGAKTLSDTNMDLAGQLPANKAFLIQSVEVILWPSTPSVSGALPSAYGAGAVAASVNDSYVFRRSGNFKLTIGSKDYITEAPLSVFPQKSSFEVSGALSDATTAAASQQSRLAYANVKGRPYFVDPNIMLISTQNFGVTLAWPEGLQVINNAARVFIRLDGILYRKSQ